MARPGGPLGDVPVQVFHVAIRDGRTTTVRLTAAARGTGTPAAAAGKAAKGLAAAEPPTVSMPASTAGRSAGAGGGSAKPAAGTVYVTAHAAGRLIVDGVVRGSLAAGAPLRVSGLSFARHRFELRYPGGSTDSVDVAVSAGSPNRLVAFRRALSAAVSYQRRGFLRAASVSIQGQTYPLSTAPQYEQALNAIAGLPGLSSSLRSLVEKTRVYLAQRRTSAGVFWASGGARLRLDTNIATMVSLYRQTGARAKPLVSAAPADLLVYALTSKGLSVTQNGGLTWRTALANEGGQGIRLSTVGASRGSILVTSASDLLLSSDRGRSWRNYNAVNGLPSNEIEAAFLSGSAIYAATGAGLALSADGGSSWKTLPRRAVSAPKRVSRLFASGREVYEATDRGLLISRNGGESWTTYTAAAGLGSDRVNDLFAVGRDVYAATQRGLSVSRDDGASWTTYTTAIGLSSNEVNGVDVVRGIIYAATSRGLSVSRDGGATWQSFTVSEGLASNTVTCVRAAGSAIYVGTNKGLSISPDGGGSWTTYTTADGLASSAVLDVALP